MPKIHVPEPDVKGYTDEHLRRIAINHKALHGKLPYPDPVPELALTKRNPSAVDKLWANKWNLVRHFIISGGGTALSTFTLTRDLATTGGAFVIGGIIGVARKGNDDLRRSEGRPDFLTSVKDKVVRPKLEGDDVNPILTMLLGSLDTILVMLKNAMATSAEADKYMKALAMNVLYFEDELHAMADKTETAYDDAFVTELVEAAHTIWGE